MDEKLTLEEFHKKIAVATNNGIWPTLDKKDPSEKELEDALHMAHTSFYHWSKIGQPINKARAEYMISRVYCALGWEVPAIFHAKQCLQITETTGIGDFDLAFAHEVLARAYGVAGNNKECKKFYNLAKEAIKDVKDEQDKKICESELEKVNCD